MMKNDYNQSLDNLYEENTNKENKEEFNLVGEIIEMIIYFLVVLILFLLLQFFVGQHIEVNGKSMENTLSDKDHLILEKVSYRFRDPARFDIIVFRPFETNEDKDTYYIKRIIGLPGESVQIIDGQILINDKVLEENYGNEIIANAGIASEKIILSDDEYFLLGDNRNNSSDSRCKAIGPVKRDVIIGRAWTRIWPLKDIEILDH